MTSWENIRSFETANYSIDYSVAPEDDIDLSWDNTGEVAEGLDSGKYVAFVARVQVTHKPTGAVMGTDYLGGCIYESAESFIKDSGYFRDMVSEACQGAREQAKTLRTINLRNV